MKNTLRILVLLVGFSLLSSCSPATSSPPGSTPTLKPASENVEATIIGLEHKWAEAIVNRDMGTLNDLIAEDFTGTSWSGDTYSKTKAVNDVELRVYVAESLDLEGINAKVFGDTAVVTFSQVEKSKYENKDCSGRYGYSDVWMKRNGSWKAVSSYGRIE